MQYRSFGCSARFCRDGEDVSIHPALVSSFKCHRLSWRPECCHGCCCCWCRQCCRHCCHTAAIIAAAAVLRIWPPDLVYPLQPCWILWQGTRHWQLWKHQVCCFRALGPYDNMVEPLLTSFCGCGADKPMDPLTAMGHAAAQAIMCILCSTTGCRFMWVGLLVLRHCTFP